MMHAAAQEASWQQQQMAHVGQPRLCNIRDGRFPIPKKPVIAVDLDEVLGDFCPGDC